MYSHEKDSDENLNKQKLSNNSERIAQKVLHERLVKIIRCELIKSDFESIDAQQFL